MRLPAVAIAAAFASGIAFGLLTRWPAGRIAVRAAGGAIAAAGVVFFYLLLAPLI